MHPAVISSGHVRVAQQEIFPVILIVVNDGQLAVILIQLADLFDAVPGHAAVCARGHIDMVGDAVAHEQQHAAVIELNGLRFCQHAAAGHRLAVISAKGLRAVAQLPRLAMVLADDHRGGLARAYVGVGAVDREHQVAVLQLDACPWSGAQEYHPVFLDLRGDVDRIRPSLSIVI